MAGTESEHIVNRSFAFVIPRWNERAWAVATAAVVAALIGVTIYAGPVKLAGPWDVVILLDGAWRILSGQVPHSDFANPIGPLTYLLISYGMRVSHSVAAITYAQAMFAIVAAPWAWFVARARLAAGWAFAFTAFLALLAVSDRPLGYGSETTSYAMLYNRFSWILFAILVLQVLVTRRTPTRSSRPELLHSLSAGALVGLLLYTKVSYALAALAVLAVSAILGNARRGTVTGWFVGALSVGVGFWIVARVSPLAYLHDIRTASAVESLGARAVDLHETIAAAAPELLAVAATTGVVLASQALAGRRQKLRLASLVFFVAGCGVLISAGNAPEAGEIPVFLVAALMLVEAVRRRSSPSDTSARLRAASWAAVVLALFVAAPIAVHDGRSLLYAVRTRSARMTAPHAERINAPNLRDFVVQSTATRWTAYWKARDFAHRIDEGIALLQPHLHAQETVTTVALANPFSIALGLPPPRGGLLWWDLGFSFSSHVYPAASSVFGDADLVMVVRLDAPDARGCCRATVRRMLDIYGPYLRRRYREVAQSPHWRLLELRRARGSG